MESMGFTEAVEQIVAQDPRYDGEAYFFVREALDYTVKMLQKPTRGPKRHVSGQELLDGIRAYALQEYGPMALTLLSAWGIGRTEDFGEIVFNLVEAGKLGRTEEDSKEDFANGYDFVESKSVGRYIRPCRSVTPSRALTENGIGGVQPVASSPEMSASSSSTRTRPSRSRTTDACGKSGFEYVSTKCRPSGDRETS